jgi:hypothetical protein
LYAGFLAASAALNRPLKNHGRRAETTKSAKAEAKSPIDFA